MLQKKFSTNQYIALLIRRGFWEFRRERYVLMLRIEKKNNQASVKKGDLRIYISIWPAKNQDIIYDPLWSYIDT